MTEFNQATRSFTMRSKTEAQLAYKALEDWREPLLAHLDAIAGRVPPA